MERAFTHTDMLTYSGTRKPGYALSRGKGRNIEMSHHMRPQSFTKLMTWILREYRENGSVFGIHKSLFFEPGESAPYASSLFGHDLASPIGPAAGPHTQLTQNILAAWLSGARFIELKTVQIMDELAFGRPCIDMEDEGYNAEWSQELKLEQSVREYVKAWVLIPVLRRLLGWESRGADGTIFNLSVGYDLKGILGPRMQRFIDTMLDASEAIGEYREELRRFFPEFADIEVENTLTDSCTLSTMHGCPPDEIGRIAKYLLEERGFHLSVKLNPTLMGPDFVRGTLNRTLGYADIEIPDPVFENDLKYPQAIEIIRMMQESADARGRFFGVKLSNTLAMHNHRGVMPGEEMYMSGRSLYPITMNLWNRLNKDLNGNLNVSYSAGADAVNAARILSCGALTITIASDTLKPGGYSRFLQCLENIESEMREKGATTLAEFAADKDRNLERDAADALVDPRYQKSYFTGPPKVASPLGLFDCVEAPCAAQCAVCQDVSAYALQISRGDYDGALETILRKNPLPGVTGYVCTHLCETRCTRADYDEAVGIRALKRFAASRGRAAMGSRRDACGRSVAVIGAGPSGLAASASLALAGFKVTVFEARDRAGGMMSIAPAFRLPKEVMDEDVRRIVDLGVEIKTSHKVRIPPENLLQMGYDAVYVACGFPKDAPLGVPGDDAEGVWTALDLLGRVAAGEKPDLGRRVLVIGGGNTAMDAARTAQRLSGNPVTVVYRRTESEMPAIEEERVLFFEEGNALEALAAPVRVAVENGRVKGLVCERTRLGEPDADGRRRPEPTGAFFTLEADSIVAAIGQSAATTLFRDGRIRLNRNGSVSVACSGRTSAGGVYAGGDAVTGPAIVIAACAEGVRAAEAICGEFGVEAPEKRGLPFPTDDELVRIRAVRARKSFRNCEAHLPVERRKGFELVEQTLGEAEAVAEAKRCMQCATVCSKCVEVCPNRANYNYAVRPLSLKLPVFAAERGGLCAVGSEHFYLAQGTQIIHIDDFCNECGNCSAFCVHEGRPYMDKPCLCLNDDDFSSQDDNVFRVEGNKIRRRMRGLEESLAVGERDYLYENEYVRVEMDKGFVVRKTELKASFEGRLSLRSAVEMSVLHEGLHNSLSWLTDEYK